LTRSKRRAKYSVVDRDVRDYLRLEWVVSIGMKGGARLVVGIRQVTIGKSHRISGRSEEVTRVSSQQQNDMLKNNSKSENACMATSSLAVKSVSHKGSARRLSPRVEELLDDRDGSLPVWVRAPKSGVEHYSGLSRSKLYEMAGKGNIRSASIREPGQTKGTRLFNLRSILEFIASCEVTVASGPAATN
jgi:hypothetical protein